MTDAVPPLTLLDGEDVMAATDLSTSAGWNQTPADWRRLLRLAPEGCLAIRDGADLIGSATLVEFGHVAWLGMVLVAPRARGAGHGKRLVQAALDLPAAQPGGPLRAIGLDATDMGEPLYVRYGFETIAPIDRWHGKLGASKGASGDTTAERAEREDLDEIAQLDGEALPADRRELLASLLEDPAALGFVAREGGRAVGYAFVRPGRTVHQLGPVVAETASARNALLDGAGRALAGQEVYMDVIRRPELTQWLNDAGLTVSRSLKRMIKPLPAAQPRAAGGIPPELTLTGPSVVAAAALELG